MARRIRHPAYDKRRKGQRDKDTIIMRGLDIYEHNVCSDKFHLDDLDDLEDDLDDLEYYLDDPLGDDPGMKSIYWRPAVSCREVLLTRTASKHIS